MRIRNATHEDVEFMAYVGKEMHQESQYHKYPYDEQQVRDFLHYLIDKPEGILLVAVDNNDVPFGAFAGDIVQHWFGQTMQYFDLFTFVRPSSRGGIAAFKLLQEYVRQAKEKGADEIFIANCTGVQPEKVRELFEAIGFKQQGYTFTMSAK